MTRPRISRPKPRRARSTFTNGSATAGRFCFRILKTSLRYAPPNWGIWRGCSRNSPNETQSCHAGELEAGGRSDHPALSVERGSATEVSGRVEVAQAVSEDRAAAEITPADVPRPAEQNQATD